MTTEISRETRSQSEARKESDSYVQSEAFVSLLDDALSKQFEKFVVSVVSTVIKESVHASLDEVIRENVMMQMRMNSIGGVAIFVFLDFQSLKMKTAKSLPNFARRSLAITLIYVK